MMGRMMHKTTLTFDLDHAAQSAYEVVRREGSRSLWWPSWKELPDSERSVWHRAAGAAIGTYDPVTFGVVVEEFQRLWKVVGPVVRPYLSLIGRSGGKDGDDPLL